MSQYGEQLETHGQLHPTAVCGWKASAAYLNAIHLAELTIDNERQTIRARNPLCLYVNILAASKAHALHLRNLNFEIKKTLSFRVR